LEENAEREEDWCWRSDPITAGAGWNGKPVDWRYATRCILQWAEKHNCKSKNSILPGKEMLPWLKTVTSRDRW